MGDSRHGAQSPPKPSLARATSMPMLVSPDLVSQSRTSGKGPKTGTATPVPLGGRSATIGHTALGAGSGYSPLNAGSVVSGRRGSARQGIGPGTYHSPSSANVSGGRTSAPPGTLSVQGGVTPPTASPVKVVGPGGSGTGEGGGGGGGGGVPSDVEAALRASPSDSGDSERGQSGLPDPPVGTICISSRSLPAATALPWPLRAGSGLANFHRRVAVFCVAATAGDAAAMTRVAGLAVSSGPRGYAGVSASAFWAAMKELGDTWAASANLSYMEPGWFTSDDALERRLAALQADVESMVATARRTEKHALTSVIDPTTLPSLADVPLMLALSRKSVTTSVSSPGPNVSTVSVTTSPASAGPARGSAFPNSASPLNGSLISSGSTGSMASATGVGVGSAPYGRWASTEAGYVIGFLDDLWWMLKTRRSLIGLYKAFSATANGGGPDLRMVVNQAGALEAQVVAENRHPATQPLLEVVGAEVQALKALSEATHTVRSFDLLLSLRAVWCGKQALAEWRKSASKAEAALDPKNDKGFAGGGGYQTVEPVDLNTSGADVRLPKREVRHSIRSSSSSLDASGATSPVSSPGKSSPASAQPSPAVSPDAGRSGAASPAMLQGGSLEAAAAAAALASSQDRFGYEDFPSSSKEAVKMPLVLSGVCVYSWMELWLRSLTSKLTLYHMGKLLELQSAVDSSQFASADRRANIATSLVAAVNSTGGAGGAIGGSSWGLTGVGASGGKVIPGMMVRGAFPPTISPGGVVRHGVLPLGTLRLVERISSFASSAGASFVALMLRPGPGSGGPEWKPVFCFPGGSVNGRMAAGVGRVISGNNKSGVAAVWDTGLPGTAYSIVVDPRISAVVVYLGRKKGRDTVTSAFLTELASSLKLTGVWGALKPTKLRSQLP